MSSSTKAFAFRRSGRDEMTCEITVREVLDAAYGAYTWPCAVVLADYIWKHSTQFGGTTVVELGCGTSLPGLVAAQAGASRVFLTDRLDSPQLLDNIRACVALNAARIPRTTSVDVVGVQWGRFSHPGVLELADRAAGEADWLLGSDTFYDPKDFDDLLAVVAFLLERNSRCKFLTTYQERSSKRTIDHLLDKWDLAGRVLPVHEVPEEYAGIEGISSVFILLIERKDAEVPL